jgi:hypothetical protein
MATEVMKLSHQKRTVMLETSLYDAESREWVTYALSASLMDEVRGPRRPHAD